MPRDLLAERPPRDLLVPERKGLFTTREESGNVHLGGYAGDLLNSVKRTLSLPGEVYRGDVQVYGPDGRTSQELIERGAEAGAVMSPVPAPVRAGSRAIEGVARAMRKQAADVPTRQELKSATDAGYDFARDLGVVYRGPAVGRMGEAIKQNLMREGIHPEDAARTYAKLDRLSSPPEGANSLFSEVESARKAFNTIAYDKSATVTDAERSAAKSAISAIDDFFENPTPQSVLAGPARAVASAIREARANAAAGFRSRDINRKEVASELNAAASNSGKNIDNIIRQRIKWFLDPEHPERIAGYSKEEIAALNSVVRGSATRNTMRYVGNLLGGGGGLGMAVTGGVGGIVGGAAGGIPGVIAGVAPAATGAGARSVSNALTRRALSRTDDLVRQRSPLFQSRSAAAPMVSASPAAREAVLKALLLQMQGKNSPLRVELNAGERDRMMGGAL